MIGIIFWPPPIAPLRGRCQVRACRSSSRKRQVLRRVANVLPCFALCFPRLPCRQWTTRGTTGARLHGRGHPHHCRSSLYRTWQHRRNTWGGRGRGIIMQCTYYYGGTFVGGDLDRRWISAPVADLSAFAGHSVYIKEPPPHAPLSPAFCFNQVDGFCGVGGPWLRKAFANASERQHQHRS